MAEKTVGLMQSVVDHIWKQGGLVLRIVVKNPMADPLIIVTAKFREGNQVAFVGGRDVEHCLTKLANQVRAQSVDWREDRYEPPNGGGA